MASSSDLDMVEVLILTWLAILEIPGVNIQTIFGIN
jgi:hypothetical protein